MLCCVQVVLRRQHSFGARPPLRWQQQHQHQHRQLLVCQAATDLTKFANQAYLDKAAQRFKLGKRGGGVYHMGNQ